MRVHSHIVWNLYEILIRITVHEEEKLHQLWEFWNWIFFIVLDKIDCVLPHFETILTVYRNFGRNSCWIKSWWIRGSSITQRIMKCHKRHLSRKYCKSTVMWHECSRKSMNNYSHFARSLIQSLEYASQKWHANKTTKEIICLLCRIIRNMFCMAWMDAWDFHGWKKFRVQKQRLQKLEMLRRNQMICDIIMVNIQKNTRKNAKFKRFDIHNSNPQS